MLSFRARIPLSLLLAGVCLPGLAAQSTSELIAAPLEESVTIDRPIVINAIGIPLTLISLRGDFGLVVRSANRGSGTASGIEVDVQAMTTQPLVTASAKGMDIDALATSPLTGGISSAIGLSILASAGGDDADARGITVSSFAGGQSDYAEGISATSDAQISSGVVGRSTADGFGIGVEGTGPDFGVFANGNMGASGTKSFVQPHPTDPARVIQFICLEGNESGTYFRGKAWLVNGRAEIAIPEEWRLVTEEEGITVQVTPLGSPSLLYVAESSRERIVVAGSPDCEFSYFVNGIRRGFGSYEPFRPNHAFRPAIRGVPFGDQFPRELREVLVGNGTLKPDFTPDEGTANALGWRLRDPESVPVEHRWWLDQSERQRLASERERLQAPQR